MKRLSLLCRCVLSFVTAISGVSAQSTGTTYLRGGTIIDGTGRPPFQATVEIRDGRIVSVDVAPPVFGNMSTRNAAAALGLEYEIGTVEAGKRADLVVLKANPLLDIRNIRSIEEVFSDGRLLEPAKFLEDARK